MPVIASQTIKIDVKEDETIQVILLKQLRSRRCVRLADVPVGTDDKEQLYDVVRQLVGEKAIVCDKNTCCVSDNYFDFVEKLGGLR